MEGLRTLSPRRLLESEKADLLSPSKHRSAVTDFQHRTSGEMAAAVQPELSPGRAAGAEKYVVGGEIFDLEANGVRKTDLRKASKSCLRFIYGLDHALIDQIPSLYIN